MSKAKKIYNFALIILALFLALTFLVCPPTANNVDATGTSAKAMCVMEATTNRVLYSKNENTQLPMASTTKIMTAITAIENCPNLDEKFEISPRAVGISGTSIYLRKGEAFSMRELLYGLMLVSGNDASVAIGERISGKWETFVELMNATAKKIGAEHSHFANTHGLDAKGHYTTAKDLALITSYALSNDTFKEIVSTRNTKITNTDGKTRYLKNKNRLLNSLDGCNGVKTGFTDDAGRCLVSSCERDGMQLVCVVLNCGPMFEESASLLEQGFAEYKMVDLTKGYNFSHFVKLEDARKEFVEVGTKGSFFYPLRDDEMQKVTYSVTLPRSLEGGVEKDKEIGNAQIYFSGRLLFSEKIYTMEEVRGNTILDRIKNYFKKW